MGKRFAAGLLLRGGHRRRILLLIASLLLCVLALGANGDAADASTGESFVHVALGDSYSSGVGTTEPPPRREDNPCYRSNAAYPALVAGALQSTDSALIGGRNVQFVFGACGGARVPDHFTRQPASDLPQEQYLTSNEPVDLVTVTMGGNDLGFSSILTYCVATERCDLDVPDSMVEAVMDQMYHRLTDYYVDLRGDATSVYVISYPLLVETRLGVACAAGLLDIEERRMLGRAVRSFNAVIADAARAAGVNHVSGEFFPGDEDANEAAAACGSNPLMHSLNDLPGLLGNSISGRHDNSFHPTVQGNARTAERLLAEPGFPLPNPEPQGLDGRTSSGARVRFLVDAAPTIFGNDAIVSTLSAGDLVSHPCALGLALGTAATCFNRALSVELVPLLCDGLAVTLDIETSSGIGIGTEAVDVILGTSGADVIDGLGGNDTICASGGDDVITGGDGDDVIFSGGGNDIVSGGAGKDRVRGQNGNDVINGGAGNDNLNGNNGDDLVNGGDGNDYVSGRDGSDTVTGGPGDDVVNGGGKQDVVKGGPGNDTMNGNGFADQMFGGRGNDSINGGDGPDHLRGEQGDDTLLGGRGNDILWGGNGADDCDGKTGFDTHVNCESLISIP